jgi:hypothetical protein
MLSNVKSESFWQGLTKESHGAVEIREARLQQPRKTHRAT